MVNKAGNENQTHKNTNERKGNEKKENEIKKKQIHMHKEKLTTMAIYNLIESSLFELLMLAEACGAENSVYISVKNLSTMSR